MFCHFRPHPTPKICQIWVVKAIQKKQFYSYRMHSGLQIFCLLSSQSEKMHLLFLYTKTAWNRPVLRRNSCTEYDTNKRKFLQAKCTTIYNWLKTFLAQTYRKSLQSTDLEFLSCVYYLLTTIQRGGEGTKAFSLLIRFWCVR